MQSTVAAAYGRRNSGADLCSTPGRSRPHPRPAKRARGTYQLTRGGAICFAAIGIIALASLNTGNNLLFMILAVVMAGMVISAVISRVILSGIQIDLAFPRRVFAQDRARIPVTIHNARRRLPAYAITIKQPERGAMAQSSAQVKVCAAFAPYVPPQGALNLEVEFTFTRRGLYQTIPLEISSHFPFGVLRRKQILCVEEAILVFPAIGHADAARQAVNALGAGNESRQRGAGGDLYAIRPYCDGDPAKHIDWKATAKTGDIKVREFTREAAGSVAIFLDCRMAGQLDEAARERFERAVSFCASLACQALPNHASLQFAAAGVRTKAEVGQSAVDAVLTALALIEPDACAGGVETAPFDVMFSGTIPLVVTDRPGDPAFSGAAAVGRIVAMRDLCGAGVPPKHGSITIHSL